MDSSIIKITNKLINNKKKIKYKGQQSFIILQQRSINKKQIEMSIVHSQIQSEDSSKHASNHQQLCINTQSCILSHDDINQMLSQFSIPTHLSLKYSSFNFSFSKNSLKQIPIQFYTNCILYIFLKKFQILIKDFNPEIVIMLSQEIKQVYKELLLKGKIKGSKFDYLQLVVVKLVASFITLYTKDIIVGKQAEAQIYIILNYVILGVELGTKAYSLVRDKYLIKPSKTFGRNSQNYNQSMVKKKKNSIQKQHHILKSQFSQIRPLKRIGRLGDKSNSAMFHQLHIQQQLQQNLQIKQLLKNHLFVTQFVPTAKAKQHLNNVLMNANNLQNKLKDLSSMPVLQNLMKNSKICYTQMSNSMDLSQQLQSLNQLKKHSIKIKLEKKSKYYKTISRNDIIEKHSIHQQLVKEKSNNKVESKMFLQVEQQQKHYKNILKKKKNSQYWDNKLSQMKNNSFNTAVRFSTKNQHPNQTFHYEKNHQEKYQVINKLIEQQIKIAQIKQKSQKTIKFNQNGVKAALNSVKSSKATTQKTIASQKQVPLKQPLLARSTNLKKTQKSCFFPQINQSASPPNRCNQKGVYKVTYKFANVYTNRPPQDIKKKMKIDKRHIQNIVKNFQLECQQRSQKIKEDKFMLPDIRAIRA